jgi:acetylglutamate kinase
MVTATKATRTMVDPDSNIEKVVDLGFVGEPDKVDTHAARPAASAMN